MMIYIFEDHTPEIGEGSYVHPSAEVLGNVKIGRQCWIGPGARIRGDYGRIEIGSYSAVEDNCVIHARPGEQTKIGDWVTIGHAAVVHNATIENWAILGMGSIVSDWAKVGVWSVVGEAALVRQKQEIPDDIIAVGIPAKCLDKIITDTYRGQWKQFKETYVELAGRYTKSLQIAPPPSPDSIPLDFPPH